MRRNSSVSPSLIKQSLLKPLCTRSCLSCTLRLYMCNVIAADMSKLATQTRFLGNYKI